MLQFDAETTAILDAGYAGSDVSARRRATFDVLRPQPGETIVDVGCGNGWLTCDLARAVGPRGRRLGVDPSADMLRAGRERCAGFDTVSFAEGSAETLPLADGTADRAVSTQVFEYIADVAPALAALRRVLRPGGLAVVSDMHFDNWAWHSDTPDRMRRMKDSWDRHLADRQSGGTLPAAFRRAGFDAVDVQPFTITDCVLRPDGLARVLMILMRRFAIDNGHLPEAEADAWYEEQHALAREGRFFFSRTQMIVWGRNP